MSSSTIDHPNAHGELTLITGPLLLGYLIGYLFYGMSTVQIFLYHTQYPEDNPYIKSAVWATYLIETVLTGLTAVSAWRTFGSGWGRLEALEVFDITWTPVPILNSLPAMIVQIFFAWRIWKLIKKPYISVVVTLIAVVGCAMAWYLNIRIDILGRTTPAIVSVSPFVSVWLGCNTFCDVLITSVILFTLVRVRSSTSMNQTSATLLSIIKFTVETGLVTAAWSILELTTFLTMPTNGFHWIFFLSRGRLYNNWLLATLNSRRYVSNTAPYISVSLVQTGMWSDQIPSAVPRTASTHVQINTATEVHRDHEMDIFTQTKDDVNKRV